MVFIPNKYCCVIFISLLLWKNCLPRYMNNEQGKILLYLFSYGIIIINYLFRSRYYYGYVILDCKKKLLF